MIQVGVNTGQLQQHRATQMTHLDMLRPDSAELSYTQERLQTTIDRHKHERLSPLRNGLGLVPLKGESRCHVRGT